MARRPWGTLASAGPVRLLSGEMVNPSRCSPAAARMSPSRSVRSASFWSRVPTFPRMGPTEYPFPVNDADQPPANNRHLRIIRSVNGHEITIFDPPPGARDKGYVRIEDAHGNSVELANGRITISGVGAIQIRAPNVTINDRLVAPVGPPI